MIAKAKPTKRTTTARRVTPVVSQDRAARGNGEQLFSRDEDEDKQQQRQPERLDEDAAERRREDLLSGGKGVGEDHWGAFGG